MQLSSRSNVLFLGVFALLPLCSCGDSTQAPREIGSSQARPLVATTFFPTTWLVERLAGGHVDSLYPLPSGADPSSWQPSRDDLLAYQRADLILINGAELEKWVAGASLPLSRVVNTAAGFKDRWRQFEGDLTHSHGGGGEHSHLGTDGHTWMSPALFELQAEAVVEALGSRGLVSEEVLAQAMKSLRMELRSLGQRFDQEIMPQAAGVRFLANHPAYDYLLKDRVELVNLDLDPEAEDIDALVAAVRSASAGADRCLLLWESAPTPALAAALESELDIPSVVFSPAENPGSEARGYIEIQADNLTRLSKALGKL